MAAAQLTLFDAPALPRAPRAPVAIDAEDAQDASDAADATRALAPSARRKQAWLALHCAALPLAAAYHAAAVSRRAALDAGAWAVIEDDRLKSVVACDARAWACGVRPGHRMNAALALCSSLELVPREPAAERRMLEHVASDCLQYTSSVSVQPPHEVLLEVRGSLRLFGGPAALIERIQTGLHALNLGLQVALAPTARSAQWLARAATTPRICLPRTLAEQLSVLPIAALRWPWPVELQLLRFGVTSVGDLMRLSRKDLARRIGAAPVRELHQALGRTTWLHRGWSTPSNYHDRVLLDFEIETTALLERMLERPLARLKRTLIGAARVLDELVITLKHRDGCTPLVIRLHEATADLTHLTRLLHEHLGRLVLRAPIREVLIEVPRLLVARPRNHCLAMSPGARSDAVAAPELAARLLEQLQSRFGAQAIRALGLAAHHVPERAQQSAAPSHASPAVTIPTTLPRRPLWLLREPRPATEEFRRGGFRIESSPETIEAEAWDGPRVRRAYYRARTREGLECWLYRDLDTAHQWFVHGLFG